MESPYAHTSVTPPAMMPPDMAVMHSNQSLVLLRLACSVLPWTPMLSIWPLGAGSLVQTSTGYPVSSKGENT